MIDSQLHAMLRRLFQHTQSMRKYQRNLKDINTSYDKTMTRKLEQQVDIDIININTYLQDSMSPPAAPPIWYLSYNLARYARHHRSLRSRLAWRSDGAHSRVSLATLGLPPRYARVPPGGRMVPIVGSRSLRSICPLATLGCRLAVGWCP